MSASELKEAQARGRRSDLWQTAEALRQELRAAGWEQEPLVGSMPG